MWCGWRVQTALFVRIYEQNASLVRMYEQNALFVRICERGYSRALWVERRAAPLRQVTSPDFLRPPPGSVSALVPASIRLLEDRVERGLRRGHARALRVERHLRGPLLLESRIERGLRRGHARALRVERHLRGGRRHARTVPQLAREGAFGCAPAGSLGGTRGFRATLGRYRSSQKNEASDVRRPAACVGARGSGCGVDGGYKQLCS